MEEVQKSYRRFKIPLIVITSLLIGFVLFFAMRVIFAKSHDTHYHANFGLFVDGKRDMFDNFTFYEEVQACSADNSNNPRQRVHLHNQEFDAIHVHDTSVTWGALFENLGYSLADNVLVTNKGVYVDGQDGKKLTFLINGQEAEAVANRVIANEDILLVTYGDPNEAQSQDKQIKRSAADHNHKPDPATCSGSGELKFGDRLEQALDFTR